MPPPMKLPPTEFGGPQRSFAAQMDLDQIDSHTFYSTAGTMGGYAVKFRDRMRYRTYGGHVYAQAAWAAAHTVPPGLAIHSMSGYFLSSGWVDVPLVYRVRVLRDGSSYVMRSVEVSQVDTEGLCFTATVSFKTAEFSVVEGHDNAGGLDVQDPVRPEEKYKEFLGDKMPQDGAELFFKDSKEFWASKKRGVTNDIVSCKLDRLPMDEYNESRKPIDRRTLFYYTVAGPIKSVHEAPNLHICNHLYLSDQAAVYKIAEHHGVLPFVKSFASLSTTVIFHARPEALSMYDKDGNERWFCQEVLSDRLADGRGLHQSRIWDDQGRHVATTIQDGQLRLKFKNREQLEHVQNQSATTAKPKANI